MEIIDAQIHEPQPPRPVDERLGQEVGLLVNVEIAREAMDCVGVDAALVFARQEYIDACVARYPDRFAGALTFDFLAPDLDEQVLRFRDSVSYLRDTTELSQSDKELIFGGTLKRVLRWPRLADSPR